MLKIPIGEIVSKIKEKTGLDEVAINKKIDDKIKELSGMVSKEGAAHIVANEFGIKLFKPAESGRLQIKNILPGLRNVSFLGRVLALYPVREFKTEKREGKVVSLLVGDETGKIRLVFWDTNHIKLIESGELKIGDIIKVTSGYVKESQMFGGAEVHTSSNSRIEINPNVSDAGKIPQLEAVRESAQRVKIANIEEGVHEISGIVVDVFESNPFFDVCPECNKRARDGVCGEHGQVQPKKSLVVSTIIDDGSGNIRVVFFGSRAQQVLGLTADEAHKLATEKNSPTFPLQQQREFMLGKQLVIEGNVAKNDFSNDLEMIARKIYIPNPTTEAKAILKEI
jgi:ssDNA-binding replication factor A large subunit